MISLKEIKLKSKRNNDKDNKKLFFFGSLFAIYFSWIFINLNINANKVTVIFFLTGIASVAFFFNSDPVYVVIAFILWRLHIIFDICDGQVARFTKKFSPNGAYWDYMIHSLLFPLVFAAICFAMYKKFDDNLFLIIALFGSVVVSQILSVKNNYYRAMLFNNEKLEKNSKSKKVSPLKNRFLSLLVELLSIDGLLFIYLIFSLFDISKQIYFIMFILYIINFLLLVLVKFILFSNKIDHIKRN